MKLLFSLSLLLTLSAVLAMVLHFESAALSYFDAWVYFLEFPLGALGILFLAELTGGEWAKQSRRYLRSLKKAFPVLILTFIPLLFFVKDLYPWSVNPDTEEKILFFKAGFYRPLSFTLRSVIYFSLLFFLSLKEEKSKNKILNAAWGLFFYLVIVSFASIDWMQGLEPKWHSSIYPLTWIMAQTSAALTAVLFLMSPFLKAVPFIKKEKNIYQDLSTILFVLLLSWAYVCFMQYLIIWSGNLPEEVRWYVPRTQQGWGVLVLIIVAGLIFVPFFFFLNKNFKGNIRMLGIFSLIVLYFLHLNTAWTLLPSMRKQFSVNLWDAVGLLGIGGLYLHQTILNLRKELQGELK